jgi:hypothetical protein
VDVERLVQGDARIPEPLLAGARGALADATSLLFMVLLVLALAGVALALALEERPLRSS